MSSESRGEDVDLQAVIRADAKSGVPHGDELAAFAEAGVGGDAAEIASARAALERAMGKEAVVEAAAVVGNFQRMVRIADGTGIPLDKPVAVFSAEMRETLGIDAFGAARNTPPLPLGLRTLGRVAQPLLRIVMSRYARRDPGEARATREGRPGAETRVAARAEREGT